MKWHCVAVAAFAGLFALLAAGLLVQIQDRMEIAGRITPPDQYQDCKNAYKRLTLTED